MDPLRIAWGISFLAAMWFTLLGVFRLIVYRSGETDHTPGMRNVALIILGIGIVSFVVFGVISVLVLTGS